MWPLFHWYASDPSAVSPVNRVHNHGSARAGGSSGRRSARAPAPTPSELDAQILRSSYEVISSASRCSRCRRRLRPCVSFDPVGPVPRSAIWSVRVTARCRGWRRHRNEATASLVDGELRLGSLGSG